MKRKNGFTLAEILGVIVIIGLLLIIVAPILIGRIKNNQDLVNEAGNKIIYDAARQYVDENPNNYLLGNKYCISIKTLVNNGKLTSPVVDLKTGKNIEDHSVLATLYMTGIKDFKIFSKNECENVEVLKPIGSDKPKIKVSSNNCSDGKVTLKFTDKSGSGLRRYAITNRESSEEELTWTALGDVSTISYTPNEMYDENYIYLQDKAGNTGVLKYNPYSEHTVRFDANGGTVNNASKVVKNYKTYGGLPSATKDFFGFDAYSFDGWYTQKSGGVKINDATKVCLSGDQTLYAHWISKPIQFRTYGNCKKALDLKGGTASKGNQIQIFSASTSDAQKWYPVENSDGSIKFESAVDRNYCLDITGAKYNDGIKMEIWPCSSSGAQKFKLVKNSDGTVKIQSAVNNKYCVDIPYGNFTDGANQLQLYTCNNGDAQKWVSKCPNDTSGPSCGTITKTRDNANKKITVEVACNDNNGGVGCTSSTSNFKKTYTSSQSGNKSITIFDRAGNTQSCTFNINWNNCKTGGPNQCVGGWNQRWDNCASKVWSNCASYKWSSCASKVWNSCASRKNTCKGGWDNCYTQNKINGYHCYGTVVNKKCCFWNSCKTGSRNACVGAYVCKAGNVCQGGNVCKGGYVNDTWNNCKTRQNTCKGGWD